ncbi:MAG: (2Fe-2S)-binding protein [Ferroplasma sp.]|uniref:(2Fe-2S)-binding protein n=1 Tax=Ferroplasma sp. TaxID=2591003 RepID=UPI0028156E4C|nr:2Fe-2S iron-sulfur cluster-binding protein [Ferroplasma sp.]WMT50884.1 MAG: (2Fe-2S)-binding protein [Ferroplasma sp.]
MMVNVKVNGKEYKKDVEPRTLLATFIRDDLGLTGTHIGCDTTNCGACTVLMDGKAVKSCTVLAVQADGHEIETIENEGDTELTKVKESFVEENGLQCGFCTPGMIMTSLYMLRKNKNPSDDYIKSSLAGNLCRCTGYVSIISSIKKANEKINGKEAVAK